ncbi:hypothetical protein H4R19_000669 [Coemansia spiralis]|nr:hypothetical protein H4R19_000669 [Coemansia spiralis]
MPRAADPESPASDTDDECSRSELEDRITELESSLAAQTQLVEQRDAQAAAHAAAMAQRDQESCAAQAKARELQREVDTMARRLREAHPMARQRQVILPVEREDDTDLRAEVAALESVAQARRRRITELEKRLADLLLPFDR